MEKVAAMYARWLELVPKRDRAIVRKWIASCGVDGLRLGAEVMAGEDEEDCAAALVRAAYTFRHAGWIACSVKRCVHSPVAKNVDGDLLCTHHISPFDVIVARETEGLAFDRREIKRGAQLLRDGWLPPRA